MKATLLKTNIGKGYKLVIDGKWIYVSQEKFTAFLENKSKSVTFTDKIYNKI
jgi:hypothetical protein|tara:strand:+ start:790 stop:945 length:156 start_codon:yes stop_codon:yes gene_type:complete